MASNFATRIKDLTERMDAFQKDFGVLIETVPQIQELAAHPLVGNYDRLDARLRRMEQMLDTMLRDRQTFDAQIREAKLLVARAEQIPGRGA